MFVILLWIVYNSAVKCVNKKHELAMNKHRKTFFTMNLSSSDNTAIFEYSKVQYASFFQRKFIFRHFSWHFRLYTYVCFKLYLALYTHTYIWFRLILYNEWIKLKTVEPVWLAQNPIWLCCKNVEAEKITFSTTFYGESTQTLLWRNRQGVTKF